VRDVICRELDKVRVRGRTTAERIFEPLAHEGELDPQRMAQLARWHGQKVAARTQELL